MLQVAKKLYNAQDLRGASLCAPFKLYHGFIVKKIEQSNTALGKLAWRIAQLLTGIVAYPLLCPMLGMGMVVKFFDIPSMLEHNLNRKEQLDQIFDELKVEGQSSRHYDENWWHLFWHMDFVSVPLIINSQNVDQERLKITHMIDSMIREFKKIYIVARPTDPSSFTVYLMTIEPKERELIHSVLSLAQSGKPKDLCATI